LIKIDDNFIGEILKIAKVSPRKRTNYNFHKTYDAPVQRMLNAAEPGTYVRPHKHENPDKIEAFIILKGRALIVEFDETYPYGSHGPGSAKRRHGVEIPRRCGTLL